MKLNFFDWWEKRKNERELIKIQNATNEIPNLHFVKLDQIYDDFDSILFEVHSFDDECHWEIDFSKLEDRPLKEEWLVAFTSEFRKSIQHYNDKKLQGRILEAISEITLTPMMTKGDTIKCLKGPLEGRWRYRIGKYRIIYYPDLKTKRISLIAISSRENAYFD